MAVPAVANRNNQPATTGERVSRLLMEDVRIIYKNFEGKEGMYNREGDRNFAVIIPSMEQAEQMAAQGWNIKFPKPMPDGTPSDRLPHMQVSINYKGRPPRIVMITSKGRTTLQEEELILLDWADIRSVDLLVNPYHWNVSGNTGIKAYAQSVFVIIEEDPLELKYSHLQELGSGGSHEIEQGVKDRMELPPGPNGSTETTVEQIPEADEDSEIIQGEFIDDDE